MPFRVSPPPGANGVCCMDFVLFSFNIVLIVLYCVFEKPVLDFLVSLLFLLFDNITGALDRR